MTSDPDSSSSTPAGLSRGGVFVPVQRGKKRAEKGPSSAGGSFRVL